jgi:hypothetical protein
MTAGQVDKLISPFVTIQLARYETFHEDHPIDLDVVVLNYW